jgi:hypothetical protein
MAPEFGKPIHQLPLIPANILKKHRVRSIRGFGPARVCSNRSGAKTGAYRSAAMSARTASAANSAAASRKRRV